MTDERRRTGGHHRRKGASGGVWIRREVHRWERYRAAVMICPRCGRWSGWSVAFWYVGVTDRWRRECTCEACGNRWFGDDPTLGDLPPPPHRRYVRWSEPLPTGAQGYEAMVRATWPDARP